MTLFNIATGQAFDVAKFSDSELMRVVRGD